MFSISNVTRTVIIVSYYFPLSINTILYYIIILLHFLLIKIFTEFCNYYYYIIMCYIIYSFNLMVSHYSRTCRVCITFLYFSLWQLSTSPVAPFRNKTVLNQILWAPFINLTLCWRFILCCQSFPSCRKDEYTFTLRISVWVFCSLMSYTMLIVAVCLNQSCCQCAWCVLNSSLHALMPCCP